MTQSRKHRGYATQRIVAERLRTMWPHCNVNPDNHGNDLIETPGYGVEIKARSGLDLPAWMRQAARNAGDATPLLVVRLNGQGPTTIDDWPVVMRLADFIDLERA